MKDRHTCRHTFFKSICHGFSVESLAPVNTLSLCERSLQSWREVLKDCTVNTKFTHIKHLTLNLHRPSKAK